MACRRTRDIRLTDRFVNVALGSLNGGTQSEPAAANEKADRLIVIDGM